MSILASLNIALDNVTTDQPVDMSAYAKYTLEEAIFADIDPTVVANIGIYTGPNKTGTRLVSQQVDASASPSPGFRNSQSGGTGMPTAVLTAPTLYVHMTHAGSAGATLNLHLDGTVVP